MRRNRPSLGNRTQIHLMEHNPGTGTLSRARPGLALIFLLALSLLPCPAPADDDAMTRARELMVERDLKGRDISDPVVLDVMGRVPRHLFVDPPLKDEAYSDYPLPIGEGQTISQPYVVALMTQLLELKPGEKVLEIGTGSGYQAAVLAGITERVYTVEIRKALYEKAEKRLRELGYGNVRVRHGDGYFGWEEFAPFDCIIVTAAANHIPPPLLAQLGEGGRLVIPLGSTRYYQTLTRITKVRGEPDVEQFIGVRFVPMVGEAQK